MITPQAYIITALGILTQSISNNVFLVERTQKEKFYLGKIDQKALEASNIYLSKIKEKEIIDTLNTRVDILNMLNFGYFDFIEVLKIIKQEHAKKWQSLRQSKISKLFLCVDSILSFSKNVKSPAPIKTYQDHYEMYEVLFDKKNYFPIVCEKNVPLKDQIRLNDTHAETLLSMCQTNVPTVIMFFNQQKVSTNFFDRLKKAEKEGYKFEYRGLPEATMNLYKI
jgi:hypothetical protein